MCLKCITNQIWSIQWHYQFRFMEVRPMSCSAVAGQYGFCANILASAAPRKFMCEGNSPHASPLQSSSAWRGISMPLPYLLPILSPKCAGRKQGIFGALQSASCLWWAEMHTVVWPKSQRLFHPSDLGKQHCALQLELCKGGFHDK